MKIFKLFQSVVGILLVFSITSFSNNSGSLKIVNKATKDYQQPDKNYNLNVSILLDLSDRISPSKFPGFYKNDLGYISSIADAFVMHLLGKKIIMMNDQMQLYFEPAPTNPKIDEIANKLKIRVTKANVTRPYIQGIKRDYTRYSNDIYNLALTNKQFIGSDIWGFFNSKAKDYCMKDGSRNVLVILTDGYMYHKNKVFLNGNKSSYITPVLIDKFGLNRNNYYSRFISGKYGFIATRSDLSKLNVLVLGVNPSKNHPYDEDLLNLYWSTWFKEMGINNYQIKNADLPSSMDEIIKNYILQKAK